MLRSQDVPLLKKLLSVHACGCLQSLLNTSAPSDVIILPKLALSTALYLFIYFVVGFFFWGGEEDGEFLVHV